MGLTRLFEVSLWVYLAAEDVRTAAREHFLQLAGRELERDV